MLLWCRPLISRFKTCARRCETTNTRQGASTTRRVHGLAPGTRLLIVCLVDLTELKDSVA